MPALHFDKHNSIGMFKAVDYLFMSICENNLKFKEQRAQI